MVSGILLFMSSFAFIVSVVAVAGAVVLVVVLNRLPSVQRREGEGESVLLPDSGSALCPRSGAIALATPEKAAVCRKPDGSCSWHGERGVEAACVLGTAPTAGATTGDASGIVQSAPPAAVEVH